jgi:hypothetical protein
VKSLGLRAAGGGLCFLPPENMRPTSAK